MNQASLTLSSNERHSLSKNYQRYNMPRPSFLSELSLQTQLLWILRQVHLIFSFGAHLKLTFTCSPNWCFLLSAEITFRCSLSPWWSFLEYWVTAMGKGRFGRSSASFIVFTNWYLNVCITNDLFSQALHLVS